MTELDTKIEEILGLLAKGGSRMYGGEAVSQLEHALQCATLAEEAGSEAELITASLLHDIGHLRYGLEAAIKEEVDHRHEVQGWEYLKATFGPAVIEPVRWHVDAKRYLCLVDPEYWATLSPASKRSLELQGGVFNQAQAAEFIALPYARDGVQLRIWDDQAKVAGLVTPDLEHFGKIMASCVIPES